jgi:prepilin-type N-terminal cleavage/methylation domain-containing protein
MLRIFHDFGFRISDCGLKAPKAKSAIRNSQSAIDHGFDYVAATLRVPSAYPAESDDRSPVQVTAHGVCLRQYGFTLVEMLVAMAITLVMMAAVVTLFANVTNGVRNRRATLELSAQMRQVRNTLQQDLQGATCPGQTWQKPESNHGYIEYVEGPYRDGNASNLVDEDPSPGATNPNPPSDTNPEIDHRTSTLPSSNLPLKAADWATDGSGLGDYDDILMLTVRNENKPFVGRAPAKVRLDDRRAAPWDIAGAWTSENVESQLAEVVWFAIENPGYTDDQLTDPTADHFFGEPGYRTVYRRTLLIAPWLNPYRFIDPNGVVTDTFTLNGKNYKAEPGLLRILPNPITMEEAIAGLIAFQDRYDISARIEWDASLGCWKIMANTLGDLTKRENRFCHYGYLVGSGGSNPGRRIFPFPAASIGGGYSGNADLEFVNDPEIAAPTQKARGTAHMSPTGGAAIAYSIEPADYTDPQRRYKVRPFAFVNKTANVPATAQVMLNDDGGVVRVLHGPVPLWGERHGEDVQLTNVLAFDVRAFDPGAPIFRHLKTDTTLTPNDPGWAVAYLDKDNMNNGPGAIGRNNASNDVVYPYVGQGAYVNLGYGYEPRVTPPGLPAPRFDTPFLSSAAPWFFTARALSDVFGNQLAPGYCVYDTWSFHYENNGVNEDDDGVENGSHQVPVTTGVPTIDEGTNGLDDYGHYYNPATGNVETVARLGVDDIGERETVPPYDKPLRGAQVIIRAYERDSRVIRQMRVNQHFMPE